MKQIDRYLNRVQWSEADRVNISNCPDLIAGIHSDNPAVVDQQIRQAIHNVIAHFESEGQLLLDPLTKPIQEAA